MKLIAMTAFNRPQYLSQVLKALEQCHGIENYEVLIRAEPQCKAVLNLLKLLRGASVHINSTVLGLERNFIATMDQAFSHSNFVIYLEDDVVPSPDFLAYMEWCEEKFRNDERCFSISSFNRSLTIDPKETYHVLRRPFFAAWGFGMWELSWHKVRDRVIEVALEQRKHSWDMPIAEYVIQNGYHEMFPMLSRCQNIGAIGVHVKNPEWHRQYQMTPSVATCPPGEYWI